MGNNAPDAFALSADTQDALTYREEYLYSDKGQHHAFNACCVSVFQSDHDKF